MRLQLHRPIHLTYCSNVHPAVTWNETFENLKRYALSVRDQVAGGKPFGLGLWFPHQALAEAGRPEVLSELKAFLRDQNCYVFTLNGFPFGRFHGERVKEKVYLPDWTDRERLDYTCGLADLLAALLPEGAEGSISTLPCSTKAWITGEKQIEAMTRNLAECAWYFENVSRGTGHDIHLGLEPEPLCYLEAVDELVTFFDRRLRVAGVEHLTATRGVNPREARAIIDRRLGMCYDTCHMAIEFERAADDLRKLRAAGIRISKVQLSSALRLKPGEASLAQLERFRDGIYLHQVVARGNGGALQRWKDIEPALADREAFLADEELRVHCHVPLDWQGTPEIGSTADHISDFLAALQPEDEVDHFEIETYTWDVLPPEMRSGDLANDIAREYRWVLDQVREIERRQE